MCLDHKECLGINLFWNGFRLSLKKTTPRSFYLGVGHHPHEPSKTVDIKFLKFDDDGKPIVLSTGFAHVVFFQAVDESRNSQIHGGDYFEIDLAGEW